MVEKRDPSDLPKESESQEEIPEDNKEEIKMQIIKEVKERLKKICIGSYDAGDAGHAEDLFDEPDNLEEILDEIATMIDLSNKENWSREKFIGEINEIKVSFDFGRYKKDYNDFHAHYSSKLGTLGHFTNNDDLVDMLYKEGKTERGSEKETSRREIREEIKKLEDKLKSLYQQLGEAS